MTTCNTANQANVQLEIKKSKGWELSHGLTREDALTIAAYFANQGHAVRIINPSKTSQ